MRTFRKLAATLILAAGLFACKQNALPAKPPMKDAIVDARPLLDAKLKQVVPKKKIETVVVKESHWLLRRNVLCDGMGVFTKVWTIDKEGVEFITEANQFIDRPARIIRLKYGEKKEADTFLRGADLEVRKGPKPGTATLIITHRPEDKREVYFKKITRKFKKGDQVFQDKLLFSRKSRNSLRVVRANYWGVWLQWDKKKPSPIKYGKTKTYGENLLTVTINAAYGGKPGTAILDVLYPILKR